MPGSNRFQFNAGISVVFDLNPVSSAYGILAGRGLNHQGEFEDLSDEERARLIALELAGAFGDGAKLFGKAANAAKGVGNFAEGSFSVFNWKGYPAGGVKPTGPFRLLEGAEYSTARSLANKTNAAIHKANPQLKGLQIHEIHPVKFGGSPTDMSNKIFLTPSQHSQYTNFWNSLMRSTK